MGASSKTCSLDPMPTYLVKESLDALTPIITKILNISLQTGHFPNYWKEAIILPTLKKPGPDLSFKNFRPISNLSFLSKLTEKVVADQITEHMVSNDLFPVEQSSYRKHHSTETALLKVRNDILMNMNRQNITLLVLLDLSSAFDTIDHDILLNRLKSKLGITGSALDWFTSYLSGRSQKVSIDGVLSETFKIEFGVPQGSCLGPLLFVIYASKLFEIAKKHLPDAHGYADDTQLYLSFKPNMNSEQEEAIVAMEACISDIRSWMTTDKLMLNDGKTEFMVIGTRQQLNKIDISHITVGNKQIPPASVVRNLGSWFDSMMTMENHVGKICSVGFYHLFNIRRIRKFLSREITETLVHAFISSRLDYCNSLLFGLPASQLSKLQRLQNAAARMICNAAKFDHITPLLIELHWLPVKYRIDFKILLLTYKALNDLAPVYIKDMLNIKQSNIYSLRSNDTLLLQPPSVKTLVTLGDRAFVKAAPKLWNFLPAEIRHAETLSIFKFKLKTFLFRLAYY